MKSLVRILSLGAVVASLTWAEQASAASSVAVSLTQELDAINKIAPGYRALVAEGVAVDELVGITGTELDQAYVGTAAIATGSDIYWYLDSSTYHLYSTGVVGGKWETFSTLNNGGTPTALPASWSATTTIDVSELTSDGNSIAHGEAAKNILSLVLTKTGTVADLTRAQLMSFLRASTTKTLAANVLGTTLTSTVALPSGWSAKAWVAAANATSTGLLTTLDPLEMTVSVPVTPVGSSALTFTSALTGLDSWNLTTSSTTEKSVIMTAPGGRYAKFKVVPAKLSRSTGIATSFLAAVNGATSKRLNHSSNLYLNTLPQAVADVTALSSGSGSLKKRLTDIAETAVAGTGFVSASFGTVVTNATPEDIYGLVALTPADIGSITWSVDGTKVKATGVVGTSRAKIFELDLNGEEEITTSTNTVTKFAAPDGDAFWLKVLHAEGDLDASTSTDVAVGERDNLLALMLLNAMNTNTVTTIVKKSLEQIVAGAV